MVWLQFFGSAVLTVAAAIKLAQYGDVIAVRTRLGGMFIGTLLLAAATSLPELLTTINSLAQGAPNLAAGSIFGSNMFNMFMLSLISLSAPGSRILRRVANVHALTAGLAILLIGISVFAILAEIDIVVGWIGWDSLLLMLTYLVGIRLIQSSNTSAPVPEQLLEEPAQIPGLWHAAIGFTIATAVLVLITPWLVSSGIAISEITGLSTGFVGALLLAIVTSLPELVTTGTAARFGAYDLAVGNLFGSNIFNMFALGLTDIFYTQGRFLGAIDPAFAMVGLLGLLLTCLGLIGNLVRLERRLLFVEFDALLILVVYILGMWLLYVRGIGV